MDKYQIFIELNKGGYADYFFCASSIEEARKKATIKAIHSDIKRFSIFDKEGNLIHEERVYINRNKQYY